MSRRATALLAVVVLTAACGGLGGGTEVLSDEWLDFDPCQLGDTALVTALLGDKKVSSEVMETMAMLSENDEVTGKNCIYEAENRRQVTSGLAKATPR